jgi:predicted ATPase/DNA-binding SARP family transcriptional activator/DNA-binding CsgD family transcriptional regulator/Flp pilus assembly protein TadD
VTNSGRAAAGQQRGPGQTSGEVVAVRIWLLGGFRISVGSSRTLGEDEWHLKKAGNLLKLLALAPGHRLHREQATGLLWPELDTRAAVNNLHHALHVARRTLEPSTPADTASSYLHLRDERLALCPDGPLWVDVEVFEDAATTARHVLEAAAYRVAIDLYSGELLPQDRYEPWVEQRRAELRGLYLSLLVELAVLHEKHGEFESAIEALNRVVAGESTNEGAHARLMRLYALSGRRREALGQYEHLRETLSREFGTEPEAASTLLQQEIWTGAFSPPFAGPPSEAPTSGEKAARHNLPQARDSFVGREHEAREVRRLLAMTRLMTLTGVGGSGKTRLALKVASDLAGAYPDGAWQVELAPLSETELVPQAVASALGVPEQPGRPLLQTLGDALRPRKMLLVVDNCEHLVDACARLVNALLDACPKLRILATSREPLGVPGEVLWTVPPLSLPNAGGESSVVGLMSSEAVRLFVERAKPRLPAFDLTRQNARSVGEVCRKLDGIPLAIELAAARMTVLAVDQVAERLENSLKLLTAGDRTADPRHQTLRATLEWSHELLDEPERILFRWLSVFAGGWTLEAAEGVCSGEGIGRDEVLDLLSRLVEKSLVVVEAGEEGAPRFRMLEPVRQYGHERLEESAEARATRYRHATFFLELAEKADPKLEGPDQPRWLDRLDEEHDNIRAALSWLLQRADGAGMALRMCAALGEYWYLRGHIGEGRRWLEGAIATPAPPSAARARALQRVARLAIVQGDFDRSEGAIVEGLGLEGSGLFRTGGGDSIAAELRRTLAQALSVRGDLERATDLSEESLALSEGVGSVRGAMISLFCIGITSYVRGDVGRALRLLEEALALSREVGDPSMIASVSTQLGYTLLLDGDLERAKMVTREAATILREQNHRHFIAFALDNLGWVALLEGDTERAATEFKEGLMLRREIGEKESAPSTLEGLASVAGTRGEARRAARLFGAARTLREAMSVQQQFGEHALEEPYSSVARTRLDEVSWEAAFAEGQAMTYDEVFEYAFSEEDPDTSDGPTPQASPAEETISNLTLREREVSLLVQRGLTNRQIASELSISESTVQNHVHKILKKLGLSSRAGIAAWAARQ